MACSDPQMQVCAWAESQVILSHIQASAPVNGELRGEGQWGLTPPPPELSDKVGRSGVERAVCWGHVRHPGLWGGGREQRGGSQGPQEERVKGLREDKKGNPLLSHRVTRANRRRIQPQMSKTHLEKYIRSKSSLVCYVSNEGIQRKKKRNYPKCNRVPNVTSTDVI